MGEAVDIKNYTVEVKGETYSVLREPDDNSGLVQKERDWILKSISLDKLLRNLNSVSKFVELAYNGTAGTKVQSKVSDLHKGLLDLTSESLDAIMKFEDCSRSTLKEVRSTFDYLVRGKEAACLKRLEMAGRKAQEMADEADNLAKKFFAQSEKTQIVVAASIDEQNLSVQRREQIKAESDKIKADEAEAKVLMEKLAESREQLENLFNEAKEKAEKAEEKSFAIAMVGAVFGALAQGVGAFAGVYAGAKTGGMAVPPQVPVDSTGGATKSKDDEVALGGAKAAKMNRAMANATAKAEVDASEDSDSDSEDDSSGTGDSDDITSGDDNGSAQSSDDTGDEDPTDSGDDPVAADDPVQTTKPADDPTPNQDDKDKKKAAAGVAAAAALGDAGRTLEKTGDSFSVIAVKYQEEKLKYFGLIQDSLAQERETLAKMAKYAQLLSSQEQQVSTLDLVVEGLVQAVRALKRIVTILSDASLFWTRMAAACKRLAENDLKEKIDDALEFFTAEERIAEYLAPDFKETIVGYLASWKALEVICREYREETDKLRLEVIETYQGHLMPEEAKKKAIELGKVVLAATAEETEILNQNSAMINEQTAITEQELGRIAKAS